MYVRENEEENENRSEKDREEEEYNFLLHRRSLYYNMNEVVIFMTPPIYQIKMLRRVRQYTPRRKTKKTTVCKISGIILTIYSYSA